MKVNVLVFVSNAVRQTVINAVRCVLNVNNKTVTAVVNVVSANRVIAMAIAIAKSVKLTNATDSVNALSAICLIVMDSVNV